MMKKAIVIILLFFVTAVNVSADEWYQEIFEITGIETDLSTEELNRVVTVSEFAAVIGAKDLSYSNEPVTIETAADIICDYLGEDYKSSFGSSVDAVYGLGIIVGGENDFDPKSTLTYAQALVINNRIKNVVENRDIDYAHMSNMMKNGIFCEAEDGKAFLSNEYFDTVYTIDSEFNVEKIENMRQARFLNYADGQLTYSGVYGEVRVYDLATEKTVIHDVGTTGTIFRHKDNIYYYKIGKGFMKLNLTTDKKSVLFDNTTDNAPEYYYIHGNYIYYIEDPTNDGCLVRRTLDGSKPQTVCEEASSFFVDNTGIYYICDLSGKDKITNSFYKKSFCLKKSELLFETTIEEFEYALPNPVLNDNKLMFIMHMVMLTYDLDTKEVKIQTTPELDHMYPCYFIWKDKFFSCIWGATKVVEENGLNVIKQDGPYLVVSDESNDKWNEINRIIIDK